MILPFICLLVQPLTLVGWGDPDFADGRPACARTEEEDKTENEALSMELLQHGYGQLSRRGGHERRLGRCRRVDARQITVDDLRSSQEPLILTRAFEILDPNAWDKSKFVGEGVWANMSVPTESFNVNNKFFHEDFIKHEEVPLREAVGHHGPSFVALQQLVARPLMNALAELNGGAHTVPPLSTLLASFSNHFIVSLSSRGQWAGMHTHNATIFTQVAGRKGWVLGDSAAWSDLDIHGLGAGRAKLNEPIPESYLSHAEVCGAFVSNEPEAIFRNPEHFRTCITGPGDALFFPGLCNGTCGWWHATCGLEEWNAGFSRQCFLDDCPTSLPSLSSRN